MKSQERILLICKERYSFPLFFVAKRLLAEGKKVGVFFPLPVESYYNKCSYNAHTYYKFKDELNGVDVFGLEDITKEYDNSNIQPPIDMDYIHMIEKEYTHFKGLNLQLAACQKTSRHYHSRFFHSHSTYENNLFWTQLSYKKTIEIIQSYKPDIILDTEDSIFIRMVINEVAYKEKIPYISIDYPRYETYKIPTFCLGVKTETFMIDSYNQSFLMSPKDLEDEYNYINQKRENSRLMSSDFESTATYKYTNDSALKVIKKLLIATKTLWNTNIVNKNVTLKRRNSIIHSSSFKLMMFHILVEVRKWILYKKNKYFVPPKEGEKYLYMPLHLIPESTTFVKAPYYIDELNIIEQVSKSLPLDWKLYVKEHQSMVGERPLDFYKRINKIPNVDLVQFNYYNDPKPWIEKSKGVITITGTAAYEAALLGKKALVFGDVPFNLIDGIDIIKSYGELEGKIKALESFDNIHSCAAYIRAVKQVGLDLNLNYLINQGEKIFQKRAVIDEKYENEIDKLMEFYSKSHSIYNKYFEGSER